MSMSWPSLTCAGESLTRVLSRFYTDYSSFDLPDDVFQPGEARPSRPKKKVVKKADPAGKKRRLDELDVSEQKRMREDLTRQDVDTRTRPPRPMSRETAF